MAGHTGKGHKDVPLPKLSLDLVMEGEMGSLPSTCFSGPLPPGESELAEWGSPGPGGKQPGHTGKRHTKGLGVSDHLFVWS